jgi:hypothetical protein
MKAVFIRALEADDKAEGLRLALRDPSLSAGKGRFDIDLESFGSIPRSPFAYWVSGAVRGMFSSLPRFEIDGRTVKQGLATTDDFRFVRNWWEVPVDSLGKRWMPFAKGGAFSPFYADIGLCIDWLQDGAQSWAIYEARRDVVGGIMKNPDYYFRPGLTYPRRLHRLAVMPLPAGTIISVRGSGIFGDKQDLLKIAGLFSSSAFDFLVKCMLGRFGHPQFDNGTLCQAPVPAGFPDSASVLELPTKRAINLKRELDTQNENSHAFVLPAALQVSGATLIARYAAWEDKIETVAAELQAIQEQIDQLAFALYEINSSDQYAIANGYAASDDDAEDAIVDEASDAPIERYSLREFAEELLSWAVGVAFGRFDVRYATGEKEPSVPADPFEALPLCPQGMMTDEDGLMLRHMPSGYPISIPRGGVLVDDPGHPLDITDRVKAVFDVAFGTNSDVVWSETAEALGGNGYEIRKWLRSKFLQQHIDRYSKSRRKAPIYWQISAPSGERSIWLYAHQLHSDTLFQILHDLLIPKLSREKYNLEALMGSNNDDNLVHRGLELENQESIVTDLQYLVDEVGRIAPIWIANLDDGIPLSMAPLWRLFPHQRAFQKDLRVEWDALCRGEYDWSRSAMLRWPDRVVSKCATDRSLAIAHGLEDVFWVKDDHGKWMARARPLRPVEQLVAERASSAVQEALARFLEAPEPVAFTKRARTNKRR